MRDRGCLIGLVGAWLAAAPVAWLLAWWGAASLVDENALEIGGNGPDRFDFADMRAHVVIFVLMMATWTAVLAAVALLWRDSADPDVPATSGPSA